MATFRMQNQLKLVLQHKHNNVHNVNGFCLMCVAPAGVMQAAGFGLYVRWTYDEEQYVSVKVRNICSPFLWTSRQLLYGNSQIINI
jgi:hypothetical protein